MSTRQSKSLFHELLQLVLIIIISIDLILFTSMCYRNIQADNNFICTVLFLIGSYLMTKER